MSHISDQSSLQRALQTLFSGLGQGARQFPQFQAQQQAFQQKQEESGLLRKTREADEVRKVRAAELDEARFRQRNEARAASFTEAERAQQGRISAGRRIGRGDFGLFDIGEAGLTTGTQTTLANRLLGLEKPTKPTRPTGQLSQSQRIGFTSQAVAQEQDKIFGNLQSQLEAKGVKFGAGDKDKQGFVLISALRREAQKFFDPEADRPGLFGGEQPVDISLLELFNQAQSLESDTARARISQNLGQFFPSLRQGGGQAQQPRDTTVTQSEAEEELRRRGLIP